MEILVKKTIKKIRKEVGGKTTIKFKYALDVIEGSVSEGNISRLISQLINAFNKRCPKDQQHAKYLMRIKKVIEEYESKE